MMHLVRKNKKLPKKIIIDNSVIQSVEIEELIKMIDPGIVVKRINGEAIIKHRGRNLCYVSFNQRLKSPEVFIYTNMQDPFYKIGEGDYCSTYRLSKSLKGEEVDFLNVITKIMHNCIKYTKIFNEADIGFILSEIKWKIKEIDNSLRDSKND